MRIYHLAVGLMFVAASPALAVTLTMSPLPKVLPPVAPKAAPKADTKIDTGAKVNCPCNSPKAQAVKQPAHTTKRRHYAGAYYHYAAATAFQSAWQEWRRETANGVPSLYEQGLHIDNDGWSGGVGNTGDAGGGGGFVDGYGQLHFPADAGNGPTYNSYNQSSQFNPSQPGPFQPRLMGGFAPRSQ